MNQNPVIPVPVEFQGGLLPNFTVNVQKAPAGQGYAVIGNYDAAVMAEVAREYVIPPGTPISLFRIVLDANGIANKAIYRALSVGNRRIGAMQLVRNAEEDPMEVDGGRKRRRRKTRKTRRSRSRSYRYLKG